MHALVTGATGFIGSNLTRRLVDLDWKVNVLIRNEALLGRISDLTGLELFSGDLSNKRALIAASKGVDIIFNCAAALPYHKLSDRKYIKTNVEGLKNLLEVTKKTKAKLVHLSTVGIYGPTGVEGINEDAKVDPQDIYATTKVEGEKLINQYQKKYGVRVVILRPTIAYGPGDTRPGFLNLFKLIKRGIFIPIGSGENYFHTVYVDNLIDALILASSKKDAVGEDFIIGDDPAPKMKQITANIAKILKANLLPFYIPTFLGFLLGKFFDFVEKFRLPAFLPTQRVKFLTENKRYRINKAKKILDFKPKIGLRLGLEKTYDWYKKNGYL